MKETPANRSPLSGVSLIFSDVVTKEEQKGWEAGVKIIVWINSACVSSSFFQGLDFYKL